MKIQAQSVEPGLAPGSGSGGSSSEEEGEMITGLDTSKPPPKKTKKDMPVLVVKEDGDRVKQCENIVPPSSSSSSQYNNIETQTWPPLIAATQDHPPSPGQSSSSHTSKVCRARAARSNNGPTPRKRTYSQSQPATVPRSPLRPVPGVGLRGELKNKRQSGAKKRLAAAPVYIPS